MDLTTFGDALRKYREEHDLSQQDLALILGTSKQVLSRYETGQRDPKISIAREYAEKLQLPLTYFLQTGFEEEKTVTIDSDDLSNLDMEFLKMLKLLSQKEKAMMIAQMQALIDLREA